MGRPVTRTWSTDFLLREGSSREEIGTRTLATHSVEDLKRHVAQLIADVTRMPPYHVYDLLSHSLSHTLLPPLPPSLPPSLPPAIPSTQPHPHPVSLSLSINPRATDVRIISVPSDPKLARQGRETAEAIHDQSTSTR
jgi:hypothetical protein